MSSLWKPLVLGLAGVVAACAPNPPAPVSVMVVAVNSEGSYAPVQASLTTISNVTALKGAAAIMIGGARITIDPSDPLINGPSFPTTQQLREIFLKQKGGDVRANYLTHSGVFWPVDFHSWNMASAYYNFERAYDYFNTSGILEPDEVSDSQVYYFPTYIDATEGPAPQNDNALYDPRMQAFIVLPFDQLQEVPLVMNRGVVAHEFSHRVFNERVYHGQSFPYPLLTWQDAASGNLQPALKILKSMDEGLGDYHAVESMCLDPTEFECDDTLFIEPSLGAEIAQNRNIAVANRCLTQPLIDGLNAQFGGDTFLALGRQYEVGTVIASSFYLPAKRLGQRQTMQNAILRGYNNPSADTNLRGLAQLIDDTLDAPQNFTLGLALGTIVAQLPNGNLKDQVCGELIERLRLTPDDIPACPLSAASPGVCNPL